MTTKVLIVDPDIAFAVPVKRALEIAGDYKVNVFANGQPAVDALWRERHDVAILDFRVADLPLPALIAALRKAQADLFILTSPRTAEDISQLPSLDVQGSITKPYFARQLTPVLQEVMAAQARLKNKATKLTPETKQALTVKLIEHLESPSPIDEPAMQPDDTFHRVVSNEYSGDTTGNRPPVVQPDTSPTVAVQEPDMPEDATIREMVSGQQTPVEAVARPDHLPEPLAESDQVPTIPSPTNAEVEAEGLSKPPLAALALAAAEDATVPMDYLSPPSFIAQVELVEPEIAQSAPVAYWVQPSEAENDIPTLRERAATLDDTTPTDRIEQLQTKAEPEIEPSEPDFQEPLTVPPEFMLGETQPAGGVVQLNLEKMQFEPEPERPARPAKPAQTEAESAAPAAAPEPLPTAFAPVEPSVPTQMAAQLTQLTVGTAAEGTLVTRGNQLVASAGQLPEAAVAGIIEIVATAWQGTAEHGGSLIRYITIPTLGDYLLYSTPTAEGMFLSMLFPADTPLKAIRKHARDLMTALDTVPEAESSEQDSIPEAAKTLPSRPTGLRPPQGLREVTPPASEPPAPAAAESAPRSEVTYWNYSFVWLPREGALSKDVASSLLEWMSGSAAGHGWVLEGTDIQPGYVSIQVSVPTTVNASGVVETLMQETAARAQNDSLWADAYYIAAPGRPVTQQEIADFMEYRRDALGTM